MTQYAITVFIGFDERQPEAFEICKKSILDYSSVPVEIIKLDHKSLRDKGIFTREWKTNTHGQYEDLVDEKPFSTQFSHSRFLVPYLSQGKTKYSVFVDSDFVFFTDIAELIKHCDKTRHPVHCVKHNYSPKNTIKMDNCKQVKYNKKLWTSLLVFNNETFNLKQLTPEKVNSYDGGWLHQFGWINEEDIGSIPESWNFIPNHSEHILEAGGTPDAIHYTEGTPHIAGYENCRYAEWYWQKYKQVLEEKLREIS